MERVRTNSGQFYACAAPYLFLCDLIVGDCECNCIVACYRFFKSAILFSCFIFM